MAAGGGVLHVVIINVALFLPVVLAGVAASWFGWMLAGRGGEDDGDSGSEVEVAFGPVQPHWPSPVEPHHGAGRDDLARSG